MVLLALAKGPLQESDVAGRGIFFESIGFWHFRGRVVSAEEYVGQWTEIAVVSHIAILIVMPMVQPW